jgi:putative DNA primase/helicase
MGQQEGETAQLMEALETGKLGLYVNEKMETGEVAVQLRTQHQLATMEDTKEMFYYDKGVYHRNADAVLAKIIQEAYDKQGLKEQPSKHFVSEVLGHLERGSYVKRDQFDANPKILNLANGIFDLETLEFKSHDPAILSTVQLPVQYAKDLNCPKFKKFLGEVTYPEDHDMIQETFGYCLWRQYNVHKAIMAVGEGNNGKSTLLDALAHFLGQENVSNHSLQDLDNRRFAAGDLYGKLANIHADIPDTALKRTGMFKMLTGGDAISAEHKFKPTFSFNNYAKLWFSCNKIPKTDDDTTAFFRRWNLITFPNMFEGAKANKQLLAEITTPEELSGIFNWAIQGLIRLETQKWEFSNSKSTEQIREEYIRKSDPVAAFVMDCLTAKADGEIEKQELFKQFTDYCIQNRLPVTSKNSFFINLPRHVAVTEKQKNIAGKRPRYIIGIQLRPQEQWGKDDEQTILPQGTPRTPGTGISFPNQSIQNFT